MFSWFHNKIHSLSLIKSLPGETIPTMIIGIQFTTLEIARDDLQLFQIRTNHMAPPATNRDQLGEAILRLNGPYKSIANAPSPGGSFTKKLFEFEEKKSYGEKKKKAHSLH